MKLIKVIYHYSAIKWILRDNYIDDEKINIIRDVNMV